MSEYTYDSIIINPFKEGIDSLIGKEVYFEVSPFLCLKAANEKLASNSGILVEIYKDSIGPFCVKGKSGSYKYPCIIVKKEESKSEYIPFKNQEEFLYYYARYKAELTKSSSVHQLSSLGGVWLKRKYLNTLYMVTEIWDRGVTIGNINLRTTGNEDNEDYFTTNDVTKWHELYENYTFPDGTPCGSLKGTAICNVEDSKAKTVVTLASNASV